MNAINEKPASRLRTTRRDEPQGAMSKPPTKTGPRQPEVIYNHAAEKAVLGCMLAQPKEVIPQSAKALIVSDFFVTAHQEVFAALSGMFAAGEDIDVLTVHQHFVDKGLAESLGSPGILAELLTSFATHLNVGSYIEMVARDSARRRRLGEIESERERIIGDPTFDVPTMKPAKSRLTFRRVSELSAMTFDDGDRYLGDRMLAAGLNSVMAGPAGIGKSRLLIQMALCCITGRDFLGMPTFAKGKRWLIFQNENSNRRLQQDIMAMEKSFGVSDADIALIEDGFIIHTLEDDRDACTHIEVPDDARDIDAAIQEYKPTFVVFDPLNTFTALDLNSDQVMREISLQISRIVKKGDPSRIPIILHHALTGKAGAAKAVGWDKGSFARNSKVLVAWCRSQFNIAPRDPDDETLLLMSCGKCSDGKPFQPMGLRYCATTGLYEADSSFDLEAFMDEVNGQKKEEKINYPKLVLDIVSGGVHDRVDIKDKLIQSGDSASGTYRHMQVAIQRRLVYEKDGKLYVNKFRNNKGL